VRELQEGKNVQFDEQIVDAFLRAFPDMTALPLATPQLNPVRLPARAVEARRA
jgi:hypothetical protein